VLLPNGTVFATGSDTLTGRGHNAIYTPPTIRTHLGTWTAGPDFPTDENAVDNFAVLLRNGNVLTRGLETAKLYMYDGARVIPGVVSPGPYLLPLRFW
jgi:hypothetical protein